MNKPMPHPHVADHPSEVPNPREAEPRPAAVGVLLADPAYFDVEYVINPHMEGHLHSVDKALARIQWEALRDVYARLGYEINVLEAVPGLPDLVFIANQSFPAQLPTGQWVAVMSRMESTHRRPEVPHVEDWYTRRGARTVRLRHPDWSFEGCGDCLWHPGRKHIYGGYGFRTVRAAFDDLSSLLDMPVVALQLVDPRFYHLDTCLSPLTEESALYVHEAFTDEGVAELRASFPNLMRVPYEEALQFAANGNCPDQKHFILQQGNPRTAALARDAGLEVIELDTSEYLKSGGSVFCMTMMLP